MSSGMTTRAKSKEQKQPTSNPTDGGQTKHQKTREQQNDSDKSTKRQMSYEEKLARGIISEDAETEAITDEKIAKIKIHISESWVTIHNAVDEVHYTPKDRRLPTKFWYSVERKYRDLTEDYDSEEITEMKDALITSIDKGLKASETKDLRDMGWKFAKGMSKLVLKKKYEEHTDMMDLFILAMRLSSTQIEEIEKANLSDNEELKIRTMWVIAQQLFGDTSDQNFHHKTIYSYDPTAKTTTNQNWAKIESLTADRFEYNEFEALQGLNPWKQLEQINYLKGNDQASFSIPEWKVSFSIAMNTMNRTPADVEMTRFMVKLANTPPENVPGWDETRKEIKYNNFSIAWVAVHKILGKTWKDEPTWDNDSITTVSMATKTKPTKRKKSQRKKDDPPVKNIHYVQRDNVTTKKHKQDDEWDRKHTTFFKIRLPPVDDIDSVQEANNRAEDFNNSLSAFWSVDERACILPWLPYNTDNPIEHDTDLHNTTEFVKSYVARFYVTEGKGGSYLRFKVAHDCDLDDIMNSDDVRILRKHKSIYLLVDKIQAQKVKLAGWWAGSINSRSGIDDLEQTLKMQPFAQRHNIKNIEIRIGQVNTSDKFEFVAVDQRVFAMHIYTDQESTSALRELLMQLYPAKPRRDYPMGRQMRFVPNISDTRFVHPPGSREKAEQLKRKQAQFLKAIKKTATSDIIKLHRPMKKSPYPTLLQVLTSWKSPLFEHEKLFVAVEETFEDVTFYYLEKNKELAEAIVPLLGIVLEEEYGKETWEWFNQRARLTGAQYTYNKDIKLIKPKQVEQLDEEWDLGIPDEEGQENIKLDFQIEIGAIDLSKKTENPLDDQSIGTLGMRSHSDETDIVTTVSHNSEDSDSTISMATRRNWKVEIDKITEENEEEAEAEDEQQSDKSDQASILSDITMATHNTSSKIPANPKKPSKKAPATPSGHWSDEDNEITMASRRNHGEVATRPNDSQPHTVTPARKPPDPKPPEEESETITDPQDHEGNPDDSEEDDNIPLSEWIKKQEEIQNKAIQNEIDPKETKKSPEHNPS